MHFEQIADRDTISTYQVSSVQLATDKKLEAFNKAQLRPGFLKRGSQSGSPGATSKSLH